jgi:hypothetical protein
MKKIFCFAIALITVVGAVFGQKVSEQEALNLSAQFLQKRPPA